MILRTWCKQPANAGFTSLWAVFLLVLMAFVPVAAHGSVTLLLEEPYGHFGGMNPTGHSALYLSHVCAETTTQLRQCRSGEYGVVISRYHKVAGYDWMAVPLIPYLYAVTTQQNVPPTVDSDEVIALRDGYRSNYLQDEVPDIESGTIPEGNWTQLVGSSYDRTSYGFEVRTTRQQDDRLIALLNDRSNVSHFNIMLRNCADFTKLVLNVYFPHAVHRSVIADLGITSPKQVARCLLKYSKEHPELDMKVFVIPQVEGSVPRSRNVRGGLESLLKSKRYLAPLIVLSPEVTGGALIAYLAGGRLHLPENPEVFHLQDARIGSTP
jgi:hypothetical protein